MGPTRHVPCSITTHVLGPMAMVHVSAQSPSLRACMLKSELVTKIAEQHPHLHQRDVEAIVNAILTTITTALARGGRVELRGLGVFTVRKHGARSGRNPRTGAEVAVSEKVVPAFKPSRDLHRRLNPSAG